jgi:hypothetical protein
MNRDVPRCRTCLMPRSTKSITFDDSGACSLCLEMTRQSPQSLHKPPPVSLDASIALIKKRGANSPYHCVVGLSGGKDSTYLLCLLTKKHKLRCLAAYYRTPFTPQTIDDNVRKITALLDVPLREMNLSQEYHRTVAADFMRRWKGSNDEILVNIACAPCKLLSRELFAIAHQESVATIIHGDNKYEHPPIAAGQFRSTTRDRYALSTNLLRVCLIAKRGLTVLYRHPFVLRHLGLIFKSSVLYLNPYTAFFQLRYPRIRVFNYFDIAEWNEHECDCVLESVGWQLPKGLYCSKKADCEFAHLKNVLFAEAAGADYLDCLFSNMVRYGVIGRELALERLKREGQVPWDHVAEVYRILQTPVDYHERA